ncbi:exonuclease SbcCD subunit D [Myxococcota bacterium]|nr:exonuclease SbcCD subunit D [Myxococcota bacterium]
MRILQTGDWHLGRRLGGLDLLEDQRFVLEQLVAHAEQRRPDLVLVTGDIYDRADPPAAAVELLDEVLSRLVLDLQLAVVLLAGNHDSPERLSFCSGILTRQGLRIAGDPGRARDPVVLDDGHGPVHLFALPYLDPERVREGLGRDDLRGHQAAMEIVLEGIRERQVPGVRTVLAGHAFVQGGTASESERILTVGGSGAVDISLFDGFDHVALGHLHRPQSPGPRIHYAGSLLAYSISESDHEKGFLWVEIPASGPPSVERVPLRPRRRLRRVQGTFQEVMDRAAADPDREDLIVAVLADVTPIPDAIGRIRQHYPNTLHLEWTSMERPVGEGTVSREVLRLDPLSLFRRFHEEATGLPIDDASEALLIPVVERAVAAREDAR